MNLSNIRQQLVGILAEIDRADPAAAAASSVVPSLSGYQIAGNTTEQLPLPPPGIYLGSLPLVYSGAHAGITVRAGSPVSIQVGPSNDNKGRSVRLRTSIGRNNTWNPRVFKATWNGTPVEDFGVSHVADLPLNESGAGMLVLTPQYDGEFVIGSHFLTD
jgi:hypothetical protein